MWLIVLAGKHLKTKCRSVISVGQVGFYHVGFKRARLRQVVIRWPDCHGHGRQVCASYNTRDGPHGGPVRCGCGSHRPAKPRQSSPCHRLPKSQIVLWPPAGVPDHGGVALSETVASAQRLAAKSPKHSTRLMLTSRVAFRRSVVPGSRAAGGRRPVGRQSRCFGRCTASPEGSIPRLVPCRFPSLNVGEVTQPSDTAKTT